MEGFLRTDAALPAVVVLCGPPGCGKSTLARRILEASDGRYRRVNQDEMKTAARCETAARQALELGHSVLVDRTNIDAGQRQRWVRLAHSLGLGRVYAVLFTHDAATCAERVMARTGHETLPPSDRSVAVVHRFARDFEPPHCDEGLLEVFEIGPDTEAADCEVAVERCTKLLPAAVTPLDRAALVDLWRGLKDVLAPPDAGMLPSLVLPPGVPRPQSLGSAQARSPDELPRFAAVGCACLGAEPQTANAKWDLIVYQHGYVGCVGPRVAGAVEGVLSLVPPAMAAQRQAARNNESDHHITLIRPVELPAVLDHLQAKVPGLATAASALRYLLDWLSLCSRNNWTAPAPSGEDRVSGLGRQTSTVLGGLPNSVLFVPVPWPAAAKCRAALALPPTDFHITVGFHLDDVHEVAKGLDTLMPATNLDSELRAPLVDLAAASARRSRQLALERLGWARAQVVEAGVRLDEDADEHTVAVEAVGGLGTAVKGGIISSMEEMLQHPLWTVLLRLGDPSTTARLKELKLERYIGRGFKLLNTAVAAQHELNENPRRWVEVGGGQLFVLGRKQAKALSAGDGRMQEQAGGTDAEQGPEPQPSAVFAVTGLPARLSDLVSGLAALAPGQALGSAAELCELVAAHLGDGGAVCIRPGEAGARFLLHLLRSLGQSPESITNMLCFLRVSAKHLDDPAPSNPTA